MDGKHIQFGNEGEALVPGETENLSSAQHKASQAAEVDAHLGAEAAEKKARDQFDRRESELTADQRAHQDQGQGYLASEGERDTGATGG